MASDKLYLYGLSEGRPETLKRVGEDHSYERRDDGSDIGFGMVEHKDYERIAIHTSLCKNLVDTSVSTTQKPIN